jgi:hypothetical protein
MDDSSAVHFAKRARKTNGESQEEAQLHRRFGGPPSTRIVARRVLVHESREWLA